MLRPPLGVALVLTAAAALAARPPAPALPVEVLRATGGLPAHVVGRFTAPLGFVETSSGEALVLDRRHHTVYAVNPARTAVRTVLEVGYERGRLFQPGVLALGPNDIFAVADAPSGLERIQYFGTDGTHLGGFTLPSRAAPRLALGPLILNGVGSMQFTGLTFLVSRPETGALISEFDVHGRVIRHIGVPRPTGHEGDADVHVALNIGLPLIDPTGGVYFVFQTGAPAFRKYDASGVLLFERHIEGAELDATLRDRPTAWPRRPAGEGGLPLVPPVIRASAVDGTGRLWVSLVEPYTYVYDARGDKVRIVQFRAADLIAPASLFFAARDRLLVTPGCYEFPAR